jgi:hypothetical protein
MMDEITHRMIYNLSEAYNNDLATVNSRLQIIFLDGVLWVENVDTDGMNQCLLSSKNVVEQARLFMMNIVIEEYRRYFRQLPEIA